MRPRRLIRLAWALWGLVLACLAGSVPFAVADPVGTAVQGGVWIIAVFSAFVVAFSTVGVLIVARQPGNVIGWLLLACAVSSALAGLTNAYASYGRHARPGELAGAALADVVSGVLFLAGGGLAATFLLLLFPTRRLPSRRWRAVGWLAGVGMVLVAAGIALAPGPLGGDPGAPANPLGIPGAEEALRVAQTIGLAAFVIAIFGSVGSLIVRFRRARQVERQQLKWLSYAAVLVGLAVLFQVVLTAAWGDTTLTTRLSNAATTGSLACVPVAVGIAILRYRLYDIDRLISRTLVYVLLTVVLGLGYAGVVLSLGQLFGGIGAEPPSWAVAAATLAMAALFQPARRRIQQAVDRRFNRRKYDAAKTIEAFSARLRDEVDLDTLSAELLTVVDQTMQPTRVSLWLRPSVSASQDQSHASDRVASQPARAG
jgi:MFS family permease